MKQRAVTYQDPLAFLASGGEMGERTRAFDWSKTPMGPAADWPQSLKTAVRIMLNSRYPMFVWWGKGLTKFYNDGYIPMLGKRHPDALGRSAAEVWSDVWPVVGPQTQAVLKEGRATWNEELLLIMERNGFTEEAYFTFSYSPVPDDQDGVGGVFCAVTEDTQRVLSQRRLRTLRALAERVAEAKTAEGACQIAAVTLAENKHDLPFALLYLLDGEGRQAKLTGLTGLGRDTPASPATVELESGDAPWPFCQVAETGKAIEVTDLPTKFGPLPGGAWPESPQRAVVLPMARPGQTRLAGFVVAGVSPRLAPTEDYQAFMDLLAGHVATVVANARAYEEERRRAEALAEIDRAKTAFFSNVSHEFRTPLTLMLGPIEDLLSRSYADLPSAAKGQLEVVNRNGLRLLRLVNTLLDFSRIEAGRVRAVYEPTDLAALTAELASNFRSACDRAGLSLVVDCPLLPEPVYVDRDMWEKVVLNLVSNAFKFTTSGGIFVTLRAVAAGVELAVRDTGIGIPKAEMPRLFERFHRVAKAQGRTQEGSGIGLALVQELVKLHGGSVAAESSLGRGTTFIVTVPLGSAHLPPDQIGGGRALVSTATGAGPYVEEALRWLPDAEVRNDDPGELPTRYEVLPVPYLETGPKDGDERPRVVVADDNADMRQYILRLLVERYQVEAVADGEAALAAVRRRTPDLILTDVMMPRLDGFGLLRELRVDPQTRSLPVIMLSARAGEESRIEGMEAGADDYLVKPFSARELLARVSAHVEMARVRREAAAAVCESEAKFRTLIASSPVAIMVIDSDASVRLWNPAAEKLFGWTEAEVLGKTVPFIPDGRQPEWIACRDTALRGEVYSLQTQRLRRDGSLVEVSLTAAPLRDTQGEITQVLALFEDVTARKRAEDLIQEQRRILELIAKGEPVARCLEELCLGIERLDPRLHACVLLADDDRTCFSSIIASRFPPFAAAICDVPVGDGWVGTCAQVVVSGKPVTCADVANDARWRMDWKSLCLAHGIRAGYSSPIVEADGPPLGSVFLGFDEPKEPSEWDRRVADTATGLVGIVLRRDRAEQALRDSEERLRQALEAAAMGSWRADLAVGLGTRDANLNRILGLEPVESTQPIDDSFRQVHPDDKLETIAAWKKAIETRGAYEAEFRLLRNDGAVRWLRELGRYLGGPDGAPGYVTGVTLDITARKRAETLLQYQKEALEMVARQAPLQDVLDFLIRGVESQSEEAMTAIHVLNPCGTHFVSAAAPSLPAAYLQATNGMAIASRSDPCSDAVLRGEPVGVADVAHDPRFPQFTEVALSCGIRAGWSTPVWSAAGKVVGTFANYYRQPREPSPQDRQLWEIATRTVALVIEHKQAEEALRESENRFRTMADTAPAMLWITGPDASCLFLSRGWYEFTGQTETAGLGLGWLDAVHPDDRAPARDAFLAANAKQDPFALDYRVRRADGEYRWAIDAGRPRFGPGGEFLGYIGSVIDIHERKQAEEAMKEADRRKDEFLATLSHELRNPLAPLRNGLQLMKLARNDADAVDQARSMMERQLGQMIRLIDDLLDVSRISRGKVELRKERVELARVVQNAVETARPLIDQASHELTVSVPPGPIYVDADVIRLAQVFANLLTNAAKYTERGGHIWLTVERQESEAVVRVRDNGVGIPAHLLPNVFDMFMQVDRSLEKSQGGLGIGLTLVKRLMEMHGGSIEAKSDGHGTGSEFVVRLPIVLSLVGEQPPAHAEAVRPAARRRILIVDDNKDGATSLAMMLKIMGNATQTAYDGLEALQVAAAFRPDVVLLDIGMPQLNGYDAARRIREQPWGRNIVLVALTGWGQEEDKRRSEEAGFNLHMVKPIEPAALEKLLASLKTATA